MLAVADMGETLRFYTQVLGFSVEMESPEYSMIDAVRGRTEIYIEVSDIRPLWDHVQTFKERYRMRGLLEREYGMTEFHIGDPNECLVFVGEVTGGTTKEKE